MPAEPADSSQSAEDGAEGAEGGEVRHLPVVAEEAVAHPIGPERAEIEPYRESLPAAIVAVTGGFIAGVTAFVLIRLLRRRSDRAIRLARRGALRRRGGVEIAQSRSFLVDVHLLKR